MIDLVKKDNQNKKNIFEVEFIKSTYPGYIYGENLLQEDNIRKLADAVNDIIS